MKENTISQTPTLAEAKAAIEQIEADRMRIVGLRRELAQRLEAAEAIAGESYLAGDRGAVREIAELEAEISLIERRALPTLDRRQAEAERELKAANAADLRQQAETKKAELAQLEERTARYLAELSKLEGVEYTAGILSLQWRGSWVQGGAHPPESWHGAFVDIAADPTNPEKFAVPRSRKLRNEIADLERRAGEIEAALGGSVESEHEHVSAAAPPNFANRSFRNPVSAAE